MFVLLHNFFYVSLTPPPPHIHSICFRRTCYWYLLHFKGKLQNHISVKSKLNVRGVGRGDCGREKNIQTWKKTCQAKEKKMKICLLSNNENPIWRGGGRNFIQYKIFLSYTTNYTSSTSLQRACWKRSGGLNLHPSVWYLNDVYFAKTFGGGAKPPLAPTVLTPMNLINLKVSFKFPIVQTQRRTFHLYLRMWYPLWTDKKFS